MSSFEQEYRQHHENNYAGSSFDDYVHAYRFGRQNALAPAFIGRSFDRATEDLRALYGREHGARPFSDVVEAVRHGYALGQSLKPLETGGLDRTTAQHAGNARQDAQQAGTAASMAVGARPGASSSGEPKDS